MGAGPDPQAVKAWTYRTLKEIKRKIQEHGVATTYKNQEVTGPNFVVYITKIGPASNGECWFARVIRYNPNNQPSAVVKKDGDQDYHDIFGRNKHGGFDLGMKIITGQEKPFQKIELVPQ